MKIIKSEWKGQNQKLGENLVKKKLRVSLVLKLKALNLQSLLKHFVQTKLLYSGVLKSNQGHGSIKNVQPKQNIKRFTDTYIDEFLEFQW